MKGQQAIGFVCDVCSTVPATQKEWRRRHKLAEYTLGNPRCKVQAALEWALMSRRTRL
jgi:hypothetical protein